MDSAVTSDRPVALVTGAAWGIGLACGQLLASRGYRVFGTSRNPKRDPQRSIEMLELEAASDESARQCVAEVIVRAGRIDALIYSIGDGIAGAIEEIAVTDAQPVLEANFWGAVRMTKAVLPLMRKRGHGRLIYMSSMGGVVGIPFRGFYSASKFALEGFAESLRYEMAAFGIRVSIVEPPGVRTPAAEHVRNASRALAAYQSVEGPFTSRFNESMRRGMAPERVARAILAILLAPNPPLRIAVGFQARSLSALRRMLPQRLFEATLRRVFLGG